ncbi:MAG: hypothetical protein LAO21_22970 [Acidobacteriia bacterium]|nr:hypothetical protein [Terriglobia bacterium]
MSDQKIIIVHLRRPNKRDPRDDPFWEFGSFGITGCHDKNLLNPKKTKELIGVRLAFAQGGMEGTRLVLLTPPIRSLEKIGEALWSPRTMPFRYKAAPLLVDNEGRSDFIQLKRFISDTARDSCVAQFASRFRSRRRPLESSIANELIKVYERLRKAAPRKDIARNYVDALPGNHKPLSIREREEKYEDLRERVGRTLFQSGPKKPNRTGCR